MTNGLDFQMLQYSLLFWCFKLYVELLKYVPCIEKNMSVRTTQCTLITSKLITSNSYSKQLMLILQFFPKAILFVKKLLRLPN